MVNLAGLVLAALLASGVGSGEAEASDAAPSGEVARALGRGTFPWYDAAKDEVKPIAIPQPAKVTAAESSSGSTSSSGRGWAGGLGNLVSLLGFGVALVALIALLVWFWRIYEPVASTDGPGSAKGPGEASRVEALPPGLRREFESTDPWEEAIRRRERGDLAGAVVCLFAHQLLTMSRLGLVRLAPGRTGRQLVRSVVDAEFRDLARPTLRLFESVYYGHRPPGVEEFAEVWQQAEAFERRVAGGVGA